MNQVANNYFAAAAEARINKASEMEAWLKTFVNAVDGCLRLLTAGKSKGRPRMADDRVHAALLHYGGPPASPFGGIGSSRALDAAPGILWEVREAATWAKKQWERHKKSGSRENDRPIAVWVEGICDVYQRLYGAPAPKYPTPDGLFADLADRAREIAINASPTVLGTDGDAAARLKHFGKSALTEYVKMRSRKARGGRRAR